MTGASCRLPNSRTTSTVISSTDSTGISGILALARITPPPRRLANIAPRPTLTLVPPSPVTGDADTVIDHRLSRNGGATSIPSTPRVPLLDSSRDPAAANRARAPPPAALQIPFPSPAYGGPALGHNSPVSAGISSSHETLRHEPASSPAAFLHHDPALFLHQDPAPFLHTTATTAADADETDDNRTTRLTLRFSTITSLFSKPPLAPKPGRATHVVSFPLPSSSTLPSTVPASLAPYYSPTSYAAHLAALQHEHAAFARQLRMFHLLQSFFLLLFIATLILLAIPSIRHRHIQLLAVALATSVVMGTAAAVSARAARAQILRAMAQYADKHASIPDARVHWAVRHAPVGSKVQAVITAPEVLVSVRDRVPPVPAMPVVIPPPPTPPPTPSPARPAPAAALQEFGPGVAHLVRRPSPISPTAIPPFVAGGMPATPPPTPVHATPAALQAQAPVAPDVSHLVQTSRRPSAPSPLSFGAGGTSFASGPDRRPSTPSPLFGAGPSFAGGPDRRPSEATAARIAAGLGMRADASAGARSAPPNLMMSGTVPASVPYQPWGVAAPAALPEDDDEDDGVSTVSSAAATLMSPVRSNH
ncbi:hypothetical protein GGF32_004528 [Allomyces javanicus]|nr:hypothetical protein GGF32_004528 [Allomyces javanicus]